jgi:hypothetical protein
MSIKSIVFFVLKIILLTVLYLIISMISGGLLSFGLASPPADEMNTVFLGAVAVALVNTIVTALIILSSRWHGWRLAGALAFSFYGVTTVMTTIEAVYFAPALGFAYREVFGMVPGLLLPNLVNVAIFMPLAVRVLGWWSAPEVTEAHPQRVAMSAKQWGLKLIAIGIIYYVLYFTFGFVVAWSNPDLQAMYGAGADNTMLMVWGVIPLQFFRGMLWVLFALPIIRMSKAKSWRLAILVGLFYALPMSIGLIIPNELMPDASARLSHFIEITLSNFIFGLIVVWLFQRSHRSVRDLFGREQITAKMGTQPVETVTSQ